MTTGGEEIISERTHIPPQRYISGTQGYRPFHTSPTCYWVYFTHWIWKELYRKALSVVCQRFGPATHVPQCMFYSPYLLLTVEVVHKQVKEWPVRETESKEGCSVFPRPTIEDKRPGRSEILLGRSGREGGHRFHAYCWWGLERGILSLNPKGNKWGMGDRRTEGEASRLLPFTHL